MKHGDTKRRSRSREAAADGGGHEEASSGTRAAGGWEEVRDGGTDAVFEQKMTDDCPNWLKEDVQPRATDSRSPTTSGRINI